MTNQFETPIHRGIAGYVEEKREYYHFQEHLQAHPQIHPQNHQRILHHLEKGQLWHN